MATSARRTKGTGGLYQRASDGMWCASVELPSGADGKRRRKVIVRAKRSDVLTELRQVKKDLEKAGDLTTGSPTLSQWCDIWWERYGMTRLKVGTRSTYLSKIEQYIMPSIGRIRLDRLSVESVHRLHDYVTKTKGLSPSSAHAAHRILSSMLSDAEREGRVTRNIAQIAAKPRVPKAKKVYLDNAQARELLMWKQSDPSALALAATLLLTGKRLGECLGLCEDSLDFENRRMTISWQLRRVPFQHGCFADDDPKKPTCGRKRGGNCPDRTLDVPPDQEVRQIDGGLYLTRPKSPASWHTIPMLGMLPELLQLHRETTPPGMEGLVFTRDGGRPIDPAQFSKDWDTDLRAAGLPDVDVHSTRHTCNTILTELGVPVDVRRQMLGHASAAVNEAVYTHTSDTRVAEAALQLSLALDWRQSS